MIKKWGKKILTVLLVALMALPNSSVIAVSDMETTTSTGVATSTSTEKKTSKEAAGSFDVSKTSTSEKGKETTTEAEKTSTESNTKETVVKRNLITKGANNSASMTMVNKGDGKISSASDFSLGASNSNLFTMAIVMNVDEKDARFQFTVPYGFSVATRPVDGFSLDTQTNAEGDVIYTYTSNNTSGSANYECEVTVDYTKLQSKLGEATPRTEYDFDATIINKDNTKVDAGGFKINIPEMAKYSIEQIDTTGKNFEWNPYDIAGIGTIGIASLINQSGTNRPGLMTKPLQVQVNKTSGETIQKNWSVNMPLPLYWRMNRLTNITVDLCIDGNWKTMTNYQNAFKAVITPPAADMVNLVTGNPFDLPSNSTEATYLKEQTFTLNENLITSMTTDAGLGTNKTVYQWLSEASAIRINSRSDVLWAPTYNGQAPVSQITTDRIKDDNETFVADKKTTITADDVISSTQNPLTIKLVNGTDNSLKVGIATIDKIPMDMSTTKVTVGSGGANALPTSSNDGYAAVFGTTKTNDYAYYTNMVASYDFPWEYSPTGTITLCPLSQSGFYGNERNLTTYDYMVTISNRSGDTRKIPLKHLGYTNPATGKAGASTTNPSPVSYTPDLAEDEWVSNITVTADKAWKQSITSDVIAIGNATVNHPLFYANCASKSTYVDGTDHDNGDQVDVKCQITTDQTGTVQGETKKVTLIGPEDNMVVWSKSDADLKWPIGEYGDTKLEYMELHAKKYTDTAVYADPYIEVTGDALGILNKITYRTEIGTGANMITNYLNLRGYRLNDGTWHDVNDTEAALLLNETEGYYDLTSKIPSGMYLTGLRLAPDSLNSKTVDTNTAPSDIDQTTGVKKQYLEETYYLYLYDKVWPDYLGYNDTVAHTYTNITQLNSPLDFDLNFHCGHGDDGSKHIKNGLTSDDKKSATLVYGDLPEEIFPRDNNYYVASAPLEGGTVRTKYYVTELCNVAIDDGPALAANNNYWGQMQYATLKFGNSTNEEKETLALTKGVSLITANWQGNGSMNSPEMLEHAIIRYKTNKNDGDWTVIDSMKGTSYAADRAVNYFNLAEGEYVTAIEIDYPSDFLYESGYNSQGKESNNRGVQLPDVGLLTNGTMPKQSPVEGDDRYFNNGDRLTYSAEMTFTDAAGQNHILPLQTQTAMLQPYPTMLVDNFTSTIAYEDSITHIQTNSIYQGGIFDAHLTHSYSFTNDTKNIDTSKVIHPTLCYELDKNFTISNVSVLANHLGVNENQITLTSKNDGSGNSILKVRYGPQGPQTRDLFFDIYIPLTAKPNASAVNTVPIVKSWLTLDYDTQLNHFNEGELISVNGNSTQLEPNPEKVLSEPDWTDGNRLALVQPLDVAVNVNKYQASSMEFYGTNGTGGGIGEVVKGHDSTDTSLFGIGETLYAPSEQSTNWVVYVAIPKKGQKVDYDGNRQAPESEYSLAPKDEIGLDAIPGTTFTTQYFIPNVGKDTELPSMAGLTVTESDTTASIMQRDNDHDVDIGTWKTWDDMTEDERQRASYVRVIADVVPGQAELSSTLLMRLTTEYKKDTVGEISAYSSLVYNYIRADGSMAYPAGENNNMYTNGKGSNYIEYVLTDFTITGQLWKEKQFNNSFDDTTGDVLTKEGMDLVLTDKDGNTIYRKDGTTPVDVEKYDDGTYKALVPSDGTYYVTLKATEKNWEPVSYASGNAMNLMKFESGIGEGGETTTDPQVATAKIVVTNKDIAYINGGIEEWGTLLVDKEILNIKYADLTNDFKFTVKADGASITREYPGTIIKHHGTAEEEKLAKVLDAGSDASIELGHGDAFEVRLPVGLGYTVTDVYASGNASDTNSYWTSHVKTLENGQTPEDVTNDNDEVPDTYVAKEVKNDVVQITYDTDSENGDGGNEEHFINERVNVVESGIGGLSKNPAVWIFLLAGLSAVGWLGYQQKKKKKRTKY